MGWSVSMDWLNALAISSICFSVNEYDETRSETSRSMPSSSTIRWAFSRIAPWSTTPNREKSGIWSRKMFS